MNKRGVALIITFMVIVVLTILGVATVSRSVSERFLAQRHIESAQAFWLAEAGISQALLQLKTNFNNLNSISATSFGQGQYSVDTIAEEGSDRRVTAHGFIPSEASARSERVITVLVRSSGNNPGNPGLITNAIETTGTLKITGSVNINPPGSSHEGSTLTFEEVFGMTEDEVRQIAVNAQAEGTGHLYTDPPSNQQPVNGITWVDLTGGNKYSVSSNWSGSGLLIVDSNGNDVALDISGGWTFTGLIWVTGRVKITGTSDIDGAVFARSSIDAESTLGGDATLNYDSSAVASAFGFLSSEGGLQILSWREL